MDSPPKPNDSPVLIVDDERAILDSMKRILERMGYPVTAFNDPIEAVKRLESGDPVHLVLTDKEMPGMSGVELARHALEADPSTVVIMLTGRGDVESATEALRMGMVDYLLKPVDISVLEMAVGRALLQRAQGMYHREMHGKLREEVAIKTEELERQSESLQAMTVASLSALVGLLEARSPFFVGHSQTVSEVAVAIAVELGLSRAEVETMRVAGLLHDIGMVAVPDSVIDKGADLTAEDWAQVRRHPVLAEEVLTPFPHLGAAVDYIVAHHERRDGSGYPAGLTERSIPLGAQILGAAEVYVGLTESRPFREATVSEEALATMRQKEDVWFDGRVLNALEAACGRMGERRRA